MVLKSRHPSYVLNRTVQGGRCNCRYSTFTTAVWAILPYKIRMDISQTHFRSVLPNSSDVRPRRKYSRTTCCRPRHGAARRWPACKQQRTGNYRWQLTADKTIIYVFYDPIVVLLYDRCSRHGCSTNCLYGFGAVNVFFDYITLLYEYCFIPFFLYHSFFILRKRQITRYNVKNTNEHFDLITINIRFVKLIENR